MSPLREHLDRSAIGRRQGRSAKWFDLLRCEVRRRGLGLATALVLSAAAPAWGQGLETVSLPKPYTSGGKPVLDALRERRTTREFKSTPLPVQTLSDLLWAAFGVNRPATGQRTAPSAMNAREIELFVSTEVGVYKYNAQAHTLEPIQPGDIRGKTSGQEFARQAPISLIFVADYARMTNAPVARKEFYSAIDAGCISQNVSVFCASVGLGTVVHDLDREKLASAMHLRPDEKIVIAQAVGYPQEAVKSR